jgi:hypothetical protein
MNPDQIEARITIVKNMIAGYTLSLNLHESECRYARRKIDDYDHELDTLMDKRKQPRAADQIRWAVYDF